MDRQSVKKELDKLAARHNGLLKADDIVKFAKNPRTACHDWFTWDDTEAAQQHRLNEARGLIRVHVRYEELDTPEHRILVREFVSLSSDRTHGGGYRHLEDVLTNSDLAAELLTDALRDFERFRVKYEQLSQLQGVFKAFDKIEVPEES